MHIQFFSEVGDQKNVSELDFTCMKSKILIFEENYQHRCTYRISIGGGGHKNVFKPNFNRTKQKIIYLKQIFDLTKQIMFSQRKIL